MTLIKTNEQIDKMKVAGKIVATIHEELKKNIKPGIKLIDLNEITEKIILENEATSTFKGYQGFPASICTSVNSVMVHGIPNNYKLKDGDVLSVDVGVEKDGWCGDAAFTVAVGEVSDQKQKIIDVTKQALDSAIKFVKPGITLGELGEHIESFAKNNGFSVSRNFVGHGIGQKMHEEPFVPNYKFKGGLVLKENMCLAIEPMFIDGEDDLFIDPLDKWSVRSKHGGLTTHFEHTIVVKENGGVILTKI